MKSEAPALWVKATAWIMTVAMYFGPAVLLMDQTAHAAPIVDPRAPIPFQPSVAGNTTLGGNVTSGGYLNVMSGLEGKIRGRVEPGLALTYGEASAPNCCACVIDADHYDYQRVTRDVAQFDAECESDQG
ncbi:hypothetical protein DIE06_21485 [Burkholderia sp. Bp8998]|nr:hypothetical protein DIE06_21485 [Burkholderia sp. Bp8998]